MTKPRIIYYYQTFNTLKPILTDKTVTHIHLSAIHFGYDQNNEPYIHLNNFSPYNSKFDEVWKELFIATQNNIDVRLMVGGAGTAFQKLFSDFNTFYPLLIQLINVKGNIIQGLDLDVEETVKISDIEMLMTRIKKDIGSNFKITLAPIQTALQYNNSGLGGFSYHELYQSHVGKYIEYLNGQFYQSYNKESYDSVVENGYPEQKVVMGMLMGQNIENNYLEIKKLYDEYGDEFGGVFIWEYSGAPKDWSSRCYEIFNK